MKAARNLAKVAPSASSRRLAGTIQPPTSRAAAITRASLPLVAQRRRIHQVSARSLVRPSTPGSPQRTASPSSATLEIERKFAPTATSMQQITSNTGTPPFRSLVHHGTASLEDAYYDTADDVLSGAGVWLRRRGVRWEAKVHVGGDFTNSAFEEITNVDDISVLLARLVPGAALDPLDGLVGGRVEEVARLVSRRSSFVVDGKFTVVLDETDFGHVVGEVELEREVLVTGGEEYITGAKGDGEERAQVIAEMDRDIDNFMRRYVWAFPPGKPVGKLSAYFALKKQRQ